MRNISGAVRTILASGDIVTAFLVSLESPDSTLRFTSAPYDLYVPAIGTFLSNSTLDKVEAPRLSETVDREAYKISLIDNNGSLRSLFENGITGAKLSVWLSFMNTTEDTLSGILPGEYLVSMDDLLVAYKGTVDTHGITLEPSNGVISAVIEGTSPVAVLGMTRAVTTSKEYIKQHNSADTSFDQVFEDGARLPWGKIS